MRLAHSLTRPKRIILKRAASLLFVAAALALLPGQAIPAVQASTSVQPLVTQAIKNTNSVHTLMHHDTNSISSAGITVKFTGTGSEDEVKNREQDYESVSVTGKTSAGKTVNLHYTADIIFLNRMTYYRISAPIQNNTWKTLKGMVFNDPYTGGWRRGRTTVIVQKGAVFNQVGVSGGLTQVRATVTLKTEVDTVDLWISSGSTPYVVREVFDAHSTQGPTASRHFDINFGPFNTPLTIQAPSTGA
jgi:hypothetical protein